MKHWSMRGGIAWILWPFSLLYYLLVQLDKKQKNKRRVLQQSTAVVVVGNITVGGTGKTPFVHALTNWLLQHNKQVAVISRGYQGQCTQFPCLVTPASQVAWVGDEALLHGINLPVPVVIDPNRQRGIDYINQQFSVDVIISDDGLQHWPLKSDFDIALVDGGYGFGNGFLLPAGPLREPINRLKKVDMCLIKNQPLHPSLHQSPWPTFLIAAQGLFDQQHLAISSDDLLGKRITLVTSIANPESFYQSLVQYYPQLLKESPLIEKRVFRDHYLLTPKDIQVESGIVIMTEKDAVKCLHFNLPFYYLKVKAQLSEDIQLNLTRQLLPIIEKSVL